MRQDYYESKLYPLQDKVLQLVEMTGTTFYLTGGTALGRYYLNHRYSDDLDFFLNNDASFSDETQKIYQTLHEFFGNSLQRLIDSSSFHRWVVSEDGIVLKLELINDVGFRKGKPIKTSLYNLTDTLENIASNKISALSRNEPKDIADIIFIEELYTPEWHVIVEDAKKKDLGVNELEVAAVIGKYPVDLLANVRWVKEPNLDDCKRRLTKIARDIISRGES